MIYTALGSSIPSYIIQLRTLRQFLEKTIDLQTYFVLLGLGIFTAGILRKQQ